MIPIKVFMKTTSATRNEITLGTAIGMSINSLITSRWNAMYRHDGNWFGKSIAAYKKTYSAPNPLLYEKGNVLVAADERFNVAGEQHL